ncbi:MAG: cytochrome c [Chitinophagaceae bacterium]|nr:cytochrome c [Chitinophagaceae bacterium]
MNKTQSIVVASLLVSVGLMSCNSGNMRRNPGKIYTPDMTYSRAYDAYTQNPNFSDTQTSRVPIKGTIANNIDLPDHLVEGDTNAYKALSTSYRFNDAELTEGGRLYMIYCGICHGTNLDGNGPLYSSGKFPAMPANLKDGKYLSMNVGTMYAAIKFGKGLMGSYSSQLQTKQRWQVIAFIKKIQSENGGSPYIYGTTTSTPGSAIVDSAATVN